MSGRVIGLIKRAFQAFRVLEFTLNKYAKEKIKHYKTLSWAINWPGKKNKDIEQLMLLHDLSVKYRYSNGETSLHLAVKSGSLEKVRLLVSKYLADVNAKDEQGNTPLCTLATSDHDNKKAIGRFLERRGAKLEDANNQGQTPKALGLILSFDSSSGSGLRTSDSSTVAQSK